MSRAAELQKIKGYCTTWLEETRDRVEVLSKQYDEISDGPNVKESMLAPIVNELAKLETWYLKLSELNELIPAHVDSDELNTMHDYFRALGNDEFRERE